MFATIVFKTTRRARAQATFRVGGLVIAVFAISALSGCASLTSPSHATAAETVKLPSSSPSAEARAKESKEIGATCAIMSVIDTNIYNTGSLKTDGSLSAQASDAILNTVSTDLRLIYGVPGYGLQPDVGALIDATATASKTYAGVSFDPLGAQFVDPHARVLSKCQANGTPVNIVDATNPRANKP